jgi:anti-sigma factor ChrR (cupin superfamily)
MGWPGIEQKILLQDQETGLTTALIRMAPGTELPDHEHTATEQTYVLEGRLVDDQGAVAAGNYVWRPAGSGHAARAPEGALFLAFLMAPNRFRSQQT